MGYMIYAFAAKSNEAAIVDVLERSIEGDLWRSALMQEMAGYGKATVKAVGPVIRQLKTIDPPLGAAGVLRFAGKILVYLSLGWDVWWVVDTQAADAC